MPRPARGRLAYRPGAPSARRARGRGVTPAPSLRAPLAPGARRAARRGARPSALVVAFSLLAVVLMLTLTTRTAAVARLGYEIGNLERQIESLERAGEQLRLQGAQLGAVARIEEQASTRLSMTRPQEVRLVMAPSPAVNAAVAEGGSVTFLATSAEPGAVYAAAGVLTQGAGRQSPATQYMAAAGVDEPAGGEPGGAGGGGWLLRLAAALLRWLPSTAPVEATPLP